MILISVGTEAAELRVGGDSYQDKLITEAREMHQLVEIENPVDKRIERIVVVPYDVFQAGELFPLVLNSVHWTTHEEVIRRELLFQEGDVWDQDLAEESARNLRSYLFVSVGRIVAVRGATP
ncbi:MAG: hypothetical protein AAB425_12010, partial [Bdellovibrionota bacterium]